MDGCQTVGRGWVVLEMSSLSVSGCGTEKWRMR